MKTLLSSALVFFISSTVFAEIPEIRAKNVTCQELKDAVLNYGQVTVLTKSFIFTKRLTVSQEIECAIPTVKILAQFKTSDDARCEAGFFCEAPPVVVVINTDHDHYRPRHDRWGHHHGPTPFPGPTHFPRPQPDRPHHDRPIPSHTNPGPRWNPPTSHDRPSHDRPSHDRPSHDRPSHDRPSHDRPSGSCHGRRCSL